MKCSSFSPALVRFSFASVYVYAIVMPHFDSFVYGFSADSSSEVARDSMPLLMMISVPRPAMPLPSGEPPQIASSLGRKLPLPRRLPSVNTMPSFDSTYDTVAEVFHDWFHSSKRLRMPRLYWSEYGVFRSLLIRLISRPRFGFDATSASSVARSINDGSNVRQRG